MKHLGFTIQGKSNTQKKTKKGKTATTCKSLGQICVSPAGKTDPKYKGGRNSDETKLEAGLSTSLELQRRKLWKLSKTRQAGFEAGLEGPKAMEIGAKQHDKEGTLFWTNTAVSHPTS